MARTVEDRSSFRNPGPTAGSRTLSQKARRHRREGGRRRRGVLELLHDLTQETKVDFVFAGPYEQKIDLTTAAPGPIEYAYSLSVVGRIVLSIGDEDDDRSLLDGLLQTTISEKPAEHFAETFLLRQSARMP